MNVTLTESTETTPEMNSKISRSIYLSLADVLNQAKREKNETVKGTLFNYLKYYFEQNSNSNIQSNS